MNSRRIMNENNPKKDTGQKKYKRRKSAVVGADGNMKQNDDNNTRKQKDKSKHRSPRGRGGGGDCVY